MTAKLSSITAKVMLSLLLAVIVGAFSVLTVVPRAVHGVALTVLTGSMTPEIPVGSVVIVRPVDPGTLQVGDVVTYQKSPGKDDYITHRIQSIDKTTSPVSLTTKGDANRGADLAPVPVTAVRGKVLFHVPFLGTLRNAISIGGSGLQLMVLGLVGYALWQVVSAGRERRRLAVPKPPAAESGADGSVDPAQVQLQMLAVTLPVSSFPGLAPQDVADSLRVDLLDEGTDVFTIGTVREPRQIAELRDALKAYGTLQIATSDPLSLHPCAAGRPSTRLVSETSDVSA